MQVVEHEPDVTVDVPVEAGREDLLLAADDAVREADPVVEIDHAVAGRDLPGAPAAGGPGERILRHNARIGAGALIVGPRLAGDGPARFRIAAAELQARPGDCSRGGEGVAVDIEPEVLALEEQR